MWWNCFSVLNRSPPLPPTSLPLPQDRPSEKPVCICIANVEQLVAAKPPFSPLLWEFMRNVYPGGISCIIAKGDWLYRLGERTLAKLVWKQENLNLRQSIWCVINYNNRKLGRRNCNEQQCVKLTESSAGSADNMVFQTWAQLKKQQWTTMCKPPGSPKTCRWRFVMNTLL